jgi:hypothetical protein
MSLDKNSIDYDFYSEHLNLKPIEEDSNYFCHDLREDCNLYSLDQKCPFFNSGFCLNSELISKLEQGLLEKED